MKRLANGNARNEAIARLTDRAEEACSSLGLRLANRHREARKYGLTNALAEAMVATDPVTAIVPSEPATPPLTPAA